VTTTTAIATAIGAAIVVVVGLAFGWIQRLLKSASSRIRSRLRADHQTIQARTWTQRDAGGASRFHVSIACAPRRRFRDPRRLDPDVVEAFVRHTFPDQFPEDPDYCKPTECVRFRASNPESPSEASTVCVWSRGLVECSVPVPHSLDGEGRPVVGLTDIASVVIAMANGMHHRWFDRMFHTSRFARTRLDWYIGFTSAISLQPNGWTPLRGFVFPGSEPQRRATDMYPVTPIEGYGGRNLSKRRTQAPLELVEAVLEDLLEHAGYWHRDQSIQDVLSQVRSKQRAPAHD
jgi:hypothetical protein